MGIYWSVLQNYLLSNDFIIVFIILYTGVNFYLRYFQYVNVYKMIPERIISSLFFIYILLVCIEVYTGNYNRKSLNYFAQSCNGPVGVGEYRIC